VGNELIKLNDIFEEINTKLNTYLDVKDLLFENEYVEVLADSFKVVGLLRNASKLISQKRFEAFLKGFKDVHTPTEQQLSKLAEYIDNEQKAEFIADTFQKILLSKSSKACLIMGTILKDLIDEKADLIPADIVCLNALTNFFDHDIANFKTVAVFALESKWKYFGLGRLKTFFKENIDTSSIDLTVEKAVAYQMLEKEIEVSLSIDEDNLDSSEVESDTKFAITLPGRKLYEYIIRNNIE
jgi:GMP synthase PP-ATPase subunit